LDNKEIDIVTSIDKNQLVRNTWFINSIFDFFINGVLILLFPLLSGSYFMYNLTTQRGIFIPSILLLPAIIICGLLFYSILTINNLKRIQGTSKEQNREAIKELIKQLCWTIDLDSPELTIANLPWGLFSLNSGRQVVILYDRTDILINCTTYGRGDLKSPFGLFTNRKVERQIIEKFERQIKTIIFVSSISVESVSNVGRNQTAKTLAATMTDIKS